MILNPQQSSNTITQFELTSPPLIAGTTSGLKKNTNEDSVAIVTSGESTRIFLADGHWGDAAAITHSQRAEQLVSFPKNKEEAFEFVTMLQNELYKRFYFEGIDENTDFTPETSLLGVEYQPSAKRLSLYNYGDCRLLIIRERQVFYQLPTQPTWLGVFSKLGLRQRQAVNRALLYDQIQLLSGDTVLIFSDGIDECIYQQPTISNQTLIELITLSKSPSDALGTIMEKVFRYGAEDNASLVIFTV
jgi:serine/threonine protein phosphatase PrpC